MARKGWATVDTYASVVAGFVVASMMLGTPRRPTLVTMYRCKGIGWRSKRTANPSGSTKEASMCWASVPPTSSIVPID